MASLSPQAVAPAARVDFRVAPVGLYSALVPDRGDIVGWDRGNAAPNAAHRAVGPSGLRPRAPRVCRSCSGAREIARMTRPIPHPYPDGEAERWISTHRAAFDSGEAVHFAVELLDTGELVGGVTLAMSRGDDRAHLTYWVGVPYWGRGYATEAAREAIRHAFEDLKLHRFHAAHFGSNPASGRVMQKVGMTREGVMREHHKKWGAYEDRVAYGLLATDWERVERQPRRP